VPRPDPGGQDAKQVVLAVAVATPDAANRRRDVADDVVCVHIPTWLTALLE